MNLSTAADPDAGPALEVVPLGGLGEFGMNMMAVSWQETTIVIDAGILFPGPELPGVDLVIPDLSYLEQRTPHAAALFLTHGHEDHIGAVPHVWPLIDGPVYATPMTLALVGPKLDEHGIDPGDRLVAIRPGNEVRVGELRVEFLRVTHSTPDCVALVIHSPVGTIVHTGDFKIDQTPLDGQHFDFHRLAELGGAGVLALLADSTNIDRKGFTGSELDVVEPLEEIFASVSGRLVVTTFASSVYRMQILVDLAERFDRKVAFVGRGVVETSQAAQRLGYLRLPAGRTIRDTDVPNYRPGQVLCITTGSQGEPLSALSRIAINDHRHVKVGPDDTVVFSARTIPGNEKAIEHVINHLARRGADVIQDGVRHVHVSGHGSEEELKLVLSLVRPKYFVPIHGNYRQLSRHARVAERVTAGVQPRTEVLLAEDGDVLRFDRNGAHIGDKVPVGRVLIDDTGAGEVVDEVLRDRRHLAEDGLLVPVVAINRQTGAIEGDPEVVSRGIALDSNSSDLLRESARLLAQVIESAGVEERTDQGLIKEKIRVELRRFFRKRSGRRPLVVPVIMEV
jgi:ribonuclease J